MANDKELSTATPTATGDTLPSLPANEQVAAPAAAAGKIVVDGKARDARGAHKKDCGCPICNRKRKEARGPSSAGSNPTATSAKAFDKSLVVEFAGQVLDIADEILCRRIFNLAFLASHGSEQTANMIADDCKLTARERATLCNTAGVLAEKYNVGAQYAPEAVFILCAGGYLFRSYQATNAIKRMISTTATAPSAPAEKVPE